MTARADSFFLPIGGRLFHPIDSKWIDKVYNSWRAIEWGRQSWNSNEPFPFKMNEKRRHLKWMNERARSFQWRLSRVGIFGFPEKNTDPRDNGNWEAGGGVGRWGGVTRRRGHMWFCLTPCGSCVGLRRVVAHVHTTQQKRSQCWHLIFSPVINVLVALSLILGPSHLARCEIIEKLSVGEGRGWRQRRVFNTKPPRPHPLDHPPGSLKHMA